MQCIIQEHILTLQAGFCIINNLRIYTEIQPVVSYQPFTLLTHFNASKTQSLNYSFKCNLEQFYLQQTESKVLKLDDIYFKIQIIIFKNTQEIKHIKNIQRVNEIKENVKILNAEDFVQIQKIKYYDKLVNIDGEYFGLTQMQEVIQYSRSRYAQLYCEHKLKIKDYRTNKIDYLQIGQYEVNLNYDTFATLDISELNQY
uniref:Uncharacterized protein n=1 Tax=Spironucleus salmonicida TaxID=348837 RepID=V6LBW3_9EUKA|eukprot:EST41985.1 Hypothetical protein SS50377_18290 [Spironucleus salmonicida]